MADQQEPAAIVTAPSPPAEAAATTATTATAAAPPAAIVPQTAPAPTSTPSSAGFKLKLKLGGGTSSTTVTPSTATPSTHAEGSTSQNTTNANDIDSANQGSQAFTFPNTRHEDADMTVDETNDSSIVASSTAAPSEPENVPGQAVAGPSSTSTASKRSSTAKTSRSRKTSSIVPKSGTATPIVKDEDASIHGASSPGSLPNAGTSASGNTATDSANKGGETTKYETSIGSIVLPAGNSSSGPSRKRPKAPTGEAGTGLGRGWRKGLKGYQRGDNLAGAGRGDGALSLATGSQSPSAGASGTGTAAPTTSRKRKSQAASSAAAASATAAATAVPGTASGNVEDIAPEQVADSEEYTPSMAAAGGLVTSEKWANGLPGGNEQSRLTASMASAVNKQFPVGPPPKTGSSFLTAQPLDKSTPRPRSWKKVKREIIPPCGVPFFVTVWQGDNESEYADYMLEHPRPVPVEIKKTQTTGIAGIELGSPAPEGSYPPSEGGTPADPASDAAGTGTAGHTGTSSTRGVGRGRGRGGAGGAARVAGPRRKPGPPKKVKPVPPPIGGLNPPAAASPLPGTLSSSMAPDASTAASSNTSNPGTPDIQPPPEPVTEDSAGISAPLEATEVKEVPPIMKIEEPPVDVPAAPLAEESTELSAKLPETSEASETLREASAKVEPDEQEQASEMAVDVA